MTNQQQQLYIPVSSPYYNRIRALSIELDFVPYNSPEHHYLLKQIEEMERRAIQHKQIAIKNFKHEAY